MEETNKSLETDNVHSIFWDMSPNMEIDEASAISTNFLTSIYSYIEKDDWKQKYVGFSSEDGSIVRC